VLAVPLVENTMLGTPLVDPLRGFFIIGTLAVAGLNYLPTRFGLATLIVAGACAGEFLELNAQATNPDELPLFRGFSHWLVPVACWVAWISKRKDIRSYALFDRNWLQFRDSFGMMWAQRVREQFNRAAANAGWPVILRWSGLRKTSRSAALTDADQTAIVAMLRSLLSRFFPRFD
jgi:hypothetical protein